MKKKKPLASKNRKEILSLFKKWKKKSHFPWFALLQKQKQRQASKSKWEVVYLGVAGNTSKNEGNRYREGTP